MSSVLVHQSYSLAVQTINLNLKKKKRQKYSTLEKLKILIFHLLISCVANYPMVGLLLKICVLFVYFSR